MKLTKILGNIGIASLFLGVMWLYGFAENKIKETSSKYKERQNIEYNLKALDLPYSAETNRFFR